MRFNDDGTTPTDDSVTVKSAPVSRQLLKRSWLTVWPIFFMVWVAVWAPIGQVRSSTFGSVTPSYTSQLTTQSTHINTNEDMQRKPLRAIYNRKEKLTGRRFYLGRGNKRWGAESTHHPMTFLLDQLMIVPDTRPITRFDSHARPYRKKNDSTHNHEMGQPKKDYEWFSSTRNKSSRKGMGVPSRADQQMVVPRGPDRGILVQFIIKIQPEDHQHLFIWETQHFFMRRSLCPGQTVSPTPSSGSANPSRPVARSSGTGCLDGVAQGL
jgi:hypothetical protein